MASAAGGKGGARRPAYLSIAADLRARIDQGELLPHAAVPSERDLAAAFGVSRMTARHAVDQLEQEGYVHRRPPRGTYVAEPRIPLRIGSFTDEIARSGRRPGAEVLWAETHVPAAGVRRDLGLAAGALVHGIQRLRRADGEPLAVETTSIPAAVCPELLDGPLDGSLWAVLRERAGLVPARAEAAIEAVAMDAGTAGRLGVPAGSPAILLVRRSFDTAGRCFEVARDLYRGDRAELRIDAGIPVGAPGADPPPLIGARGDPGERAGPSTRPRRP